MSNRARNLFTRKLTLAAATFVMVSAIATLAAFGPQSISLQRLLTPFVGASVAPQQSFKEVESQLHAEPPAPMSMIGGTLATARSGHTATLLADGKVLIVGGSGDTSAEIFDPASSMSVATGNTNYARTGHTATTLSDGRVLIAGGGSASTEIYDPAAGTFANGPDMTTARSGHTATAVGTSVVISGGGSASVEVFDGTTFTAAGTLTESRTNHSAALMNDGRIFIAGGTGSDTAEIYDPADGTSVATGNPLAHQRAKAHLRVLPDGKVQIIGGNDDVSMEVYDPTIDTIGAHVHLLPDTDTCTGLRSGVRDSQTRAALFYAGNADASYDRTGHTITEVAGNRALVIGGTTGGNATNSVTEFASSPATITTDKLDYAPGETVTFSGTNFAPDEIVRVVIHEDPHTHLERNFEAQADGSGNISGSYLVEEHDLNVKFIVNARGLTSNLTAQTAFTDAGNFSVSPATQSVAAGSVNSFTWTFTGQNNGNTNTLTFTIPAPWTAPQSVPGFGQITVGGTCDGAFSIGGAGGRVITVNQVGSTAQGKCASGETIIINYSSATAPTPASPPQTYTFTSSGGSSPTVTVTAASATALTVSPASGTYGGTAVLTATLVQTPSLTPVSGQSVAFSLNGGTIQTATTDGNGVATIAAASLSGIDAGTYPTGISVAFGGGGGYAASSGTASLTVNKATPTATLAVNNSPQVYSGSPQSATVGITASSVPGAVANVTNGTHTNAGTYPVTADFVPTDSTNYNTLTGLSAGDFVISKAGSTTTITCPTNVTYTGSALTPCTVSVTGAGGLSLTPTATYTDNTNAGTATASYNFTGDANHTGSSDSKTFTIDKASSTTTINCPPSVTYTGSPLTPCTATVSGANLSTTTTVSYADNTNVGTATANASYAGDANHTGSTATQVTFQITAAPTTTVIDCSPGSFVYTGSPLTPCTATVTGANLLTTTTVTYGSNTDVGTATANASYSGDANHTGSTATQVTFEITPASTSTVIDCGLGTFVYTGSALTPCTATVTGANLSTTATVVYANNTDVGTATANASYAGDANHSGSTATQVTFAITPASTTTVVTCPASVVYTGAAIEPCTFTVTGANLNIGPSPLASTDYSSNLNVGTATASYTYVPDANHTGSDDSTTFEILQAATALTVSPAQGTYGGTVDLYATLTRTDAPAGPLEGKTISFKLNGNSVGTAVTDINGQAALLGVYLTTNGTLSGTRFDADLYTNGVEASFAAETNFTGSDDMANLQVDPKPVTASITAQSKPYDGNASAAIDSCTVAVLETDDVVTCSAAGPNTFATVNAASGITVTATSISLAGDDAANYVLSSTSATTTADILKKGLGATLVAANKVYDGNTDEPDANMSCSFTGIVSGEELNITCTPSAGSFNFKDVLAATQVTATVTLSGSAAGNYTLGADGTSIGSTSATDTSVSILPRLLTASIINNPIKSYDGNTNASLLPTNFSLSNLVNPEDFTVTQTVGTYAPDANAGAKTVSASLAPGDFTPDGGTLASNYTLPTSASGPGTIDPAQVTVTVTCPPGPYTFNGSAITPCSAVANGGDLVNQSLTVNYTDNVNAGTATASASYPTGGNYVGDTDSATFTIDPAQVTVTVTCPAGPYTFNGSAITPCSAVVNGGDLVNQSLTVNYTDNVNAGTATASASYPTGGNYVGDTDSATFTIDRANPTVTATGGTFTYDGNPHTGSCSVTGVGGADLGPLAATHTPDDPPVNAGNYTVNCSYAQSQNYNAASDSELLTVDRANADCNILGYGPAPYDAAPHGASGTCRGVDAQPLAGLDLGASFTNVPGGQADWVFTDQTGNYNDKSGSVQIQITKINATCSISGYTGVYDGNPHGASGTCTGVAGQTIPTIGSLNLGASFTNVPGGTANWTFTGGTNYNDKSGNVAIVLSQATPTVSVTGGTFLFNGAPHPATGFAYGVGGIGDVLTPAVTFQYVGTGSTAYPATTTPPIFVGTYQITATFAGNVNYTGTTGTASITITTIYCFNGFQSPVGGSVESGNGGSFADPVKSFKLNSTIPFKFTLNSLVGTVCGSTPITTGIHTIQLQKYSSQTDPLDTAIDATPTDAATSGNQFRLTGTDWHFNLDTKKTPGLSAGTWLVTATLLDGSKKTVWISIKK